MAIKGDYIWGETIDTYGDNLKTATSNFTKTATDWDERVAVRWAEMLGYRNIAVFKAVVAASGLSDANKKKLLQPGYYPKMAAGKVTVMADGMFPNIINHNGEFRSPDGVLGLPEVNEFGGGDATNHTATPITDPAV